MGLFFKKKESAQAQNPDLPPQNATTEWFNSAEAKSLFERLREGGLVNKYKLIWYWDAYIMSLDNYKRVQIQYKDTNKDPDTLKYYISNWMTALSLGKDNDEFGEETWDCDYATLVDLNYLYYLSHFKYAMTDKVQRIILSLIGSNQVDVEKDEWLYDAKVFNHVSEAEVLTELRKIISENGYQVDVNASFMKF